VEIYGPESVRLCGVGPGGRPAPAPRIALAPGDRVTVHVDLEAACAAVPPGEYRFEVGYRAGDASGPVAPGGASAFVGTLPPQYGHVVVPRPADAACEVAPSAPPQRGRHGRSAAEPAGRRRARRPPVAAPPAGEGR
jgi:hypothetical protein